MLVFALPAIRPISLRRSFAPFLCSFQGLCNFVFNTGGSILLFRLLWLWPRLRRLCCLCKSFGGSACSFGGPAVSCSRQGLSNLGFHVCGSGCWGRPGRLWLRHLCWWWLWLGGLCGAVPGGGSLQGLSNF